MEDVIAILHELPSVTLFAYLLHKVGDSFNDTRSTIFVDGLMRLTKDNVTVLPTFVPVRKLPFKDGN